MLGGIKDADLQALLARSNGRCEASLYGCFGQATHIHHKKFRSRGGSNRLVNLCHLCARCHNGVHAYKPGTAGFRTHGWQEEGQTEADEE